MTLELARTPDDNGFQNNGRGHNYVSHLDGEDEVTLDGGFTPTDLREIADRMEETR